MVCIAPYHDISTYYLTYFLSTINPSVVGVNLEFETNLDS